MNADEIRALAARTRDVARKLGDAAGQTGDVRLRLALLGQRDELKAIARDLRAQLDAGAVTAGEFFATWREGR